MHKGRIGNLVIQQPSADKVVLLQSRGSQLGVLFVSVLFAYLLFFVVDYDQLDTIWRYVCYFFVGVSILGVLQSIFGRRRFVFSNTVLTYRWNTLRKAEIYPYDDIKGFKIILGAGKVKPSNSLNLLLHAGDSLPVDTFIGHISKYIETLESIAELTGIPVLDMQILRSKTA